MPQSQDIKIEARTLNLTVGSAGDAARNYVMPAQEFTRK